MHHRANAEQTAQPSNFVLERAFRSADPSELNCLRIARFTRPGPNEIAVDSSTLALGSGFEDEVKWGLGRAPKTSESATCHYVPQALLTCLSAESKTDLLR